MSCCTLPLSSALSNPQPLWGYSHLELQPRTGQPTEAWRTHDATQQLSLTGHHNTGRRLVALSLVKPPVGGSQLPDRHAWQSALPCRHSSTNDTSQADPTCQASQAGKQVVPHNTLITRVCYEWMLRMHLDMQTCTLLDCTAPSVLLSPEIHLGNSDHRFCDACNRPACCCGFVHTLPTTPTQPHAPHMHNSHSRLRLNLINGHTTRLLLQLLAAPVR